MAGYISPAITLPHETAARRGKEEGHACSFTLTVLVDDVDRFVSRSAARRPHRRHGRVSGAVARAAGDLRRQVQPDARRRSHGGDQALRLSLLARRARRLRIPVHRLQGRALGRFARPVARHHPPQRRHRQGRARASSGRIARGLLEIAPSDFYVQMQTLRGVGGRDAADRVRAVGKFGTFFSRELFDTYGGVLARSGRYDVFTTRKKRTLRVPEPEIHLVRTDDGKILRADPLSRRQQGPADFHARSRRIEPHLLDRYDRHQHARVPGGGRVRLLAARLSRQRRPALCARAVERRRRRPEGLSGGVRQGARRHALVDRAGHRPLLRRHDLHHVAAGRPRRRALRRHLADLDRLRGAVVPAASCSPTCARRSCSRRWASTSSTRARPPPTRCASGCSTRCCR